MATEIETSAPRDPERLAALPAFGPGVQVMTTDGELPVEWLATGDRLITRDHGAQPIVWLGHMRVNRARLGHHPELQPVEIAAGALAPGFPTHPTLLAGHSRVLLSGPEVALNAGTDEALAEIGELSGAVQIAPPPCPAGTHYVFVLLPMHALVQANGLWAETILLDPANRAALAPLLPPALARDGNLAVGHARACRLYLAGWEVAAMRGGTTANPLPRLIRRVA